MTTFEFYYDAPVGRLAVTLRNDFVMTLRYCAEKEAVSQDIIKNSESQNSEMKKIKTALDNYFAGRPEDFSDIPLDISVGTPFQQDVWGALRKIPYGETRSYGWLSDAVKRPKAARAVGQANCRNPLPIIIPCHRVINQNGDLGGYMGVTGLEIKKQLLKLEGVAV